MTDILKLFDDEHSGEAAVRRIMADLKDGGIYKARKGLIEMEFEYMNQISLGRNPPEDREKISNGLTQLVEKHGEETIIAMLLVYLESHLPKDVDFDPEDLLRNPRPTPPIEQEYRWMLGALWRQASSESMAEAMGVLSATFDVQKATASKSEYDGLVAADNYFSGMLGGLLESTRYIVEGSKALNEKGLLGSKEEVASAIVAIREIGNFNLEKLPSRKQKTLARIEKIIDELGLEAVEAHLKERLSDLAGDITGPMMFTKPKVYATSSELERAMIGLFGFDYDEKS